MEILLMCFAVVWCACVFALVAFSFVIYLLYRYFTYCPIEEVKDNG